MVIAMLNYVKPIEEIEMALEPHRAFLEKYCTAGKLICAGRKNPRTGGVIILNVNSLEEAQSIISEDPFHIKELAEYELVEVIPTKYAKGFEKFIG